jgi:hypothetical protein
LSEYLEEVFHQTSTSQSNNMEWTKGKELYNTKKKRKKNLTNSRLK